jgi:hypothetical protein
MFHTKVVEKTKTHILCSVTFLKIEPFMRYVEKRDRAGQATDDNTAHALCMLDDLTPQTLRLYKTFLFHNSDYANAPQCYKNLTCLVRFLITD